MTTLKVLLDENLSPSLVRRLAEIGAPADHIVHVGKSGLSDAELWSFALARDAVVVTINARDFLTLAAKSEVHAGLIVVRSQGSTPPGSGTGSSRSCDTCSIPARTSSTGRSK